MNFRKGNQKDLEQIQELAITSWAEFQNQLTTENWKKLSTTLNDITTYAGLLKNSDCVLCESSNGQIVGMAFLVPKGNPNDIYDKDWCHLRFVSVHPQFRGMKIGQQLTEACIQIAQQNKEQIMALHTSEIMGNARHIYEKIGFKMLKEIEPRLGVRYWLYTYDLV